MNKLFSRFFLNLFLSLFISLFLSGCATIKPISTTSSSTTPTQNWILRGKMGIKTPEKTGSASLYWQQQGDIYDIRIFGPLGIGAVELNGNPEQVIYTDNQGKIYRADSAEILLRQNTGWQIPVANLRYWILARSAPNMPSHKMYDQQHQLVSLQQQGWKIDYLSYQNQLPRLIQLARPEINLRIVINQWQFFN